MQISTWYSFLTCDAPLALGAVLIWKIMAQSPAWHREGVETFFVFPLYFYGFLCICTSATPQRPAHGTVPYQVATHLRTDRVCRVLGRSWIWTQDYWFAVRCATIEPPLLLERGNICLFTVADNNLCQGLPVPSSDRGFLSNNLMHPAYSSNKLIYPAYSSNNFSHLKYVPIQHAYSFTAVLIQHHTSISIP